MLKTDHRIPPGMFSFSAVGACAGIIGLGCMIWSAITANSEIYRIYGFTLGGFALFIACAVSVDLLWAKRIPERAIVLTSLRKMTFIKTLLIAAVLFGVVAIVLGALLLARLNK